MRPFALLSIAAAGLVAACDFQPGDPVQNATREISARYQAEAVKDGQISGPSSPASAPSSASDETAIRQMMLLNAEAIASAEAVLASSQDAALQHMARETIAARRLENQALSQRLNTP